jgi:hypothetical protein
MTFVKVSSRQFYIAVVFVPTFSLWKLGHREQGKYSSWDSKLQRADPSV